jgi:hypothetical protein
MSRERFTTAQPRCSHNPGTLVGAPGPDGPFTRISGRLKFLIEQFWGRAARASSDSKESGRPFYFAQCLSDSLAA